MQTIKKLLLIVALVATSYVTYAQVGVGTTDPKAALDITSTTAGVLVPRMDTATRTGLTVAADQNGMMVYDTDTATFWYYDHPNTTWVEVKGGAGKFVDGDTATDAVYTAGNVGIGTTAPSRVFHIVGDGTNYGDDIFIEGTNSETALPQINLARARGTDAARATVQANDQIGIIAFRGYDGTSHVYSARISSSAEQDFSTSVDGNLQFRTTNAGTSSEKMRISSAGNVGIGTTSPAAALDINASITNGSNTHSAIFYGSTNNGLDGGVTIESFQPRLILNDRSSTQDWYDWRVDNDVMILGRGENTDLFARVDDNIMVIKGSNVGIGTADPIAPLEIADDAAAYVLLTQATDNTNAGSFVARKSRGTVAAPTAVQSGDRIFGIYTQGHDGTSYSSSNIGAIEILATENFTSAAQGTSIRFGTTNIGATSRTTRMTIESNGNIDIGGTGTALNKLQVNGGHISDDDGDFGITIRAFEPGLNLVDASTGAGTAQIRGLSNGGLAIYADPTVNDGTTGFTTNTTTVQTAQFESNVIRLYTNNTEHFRLNNDGDVGIGINNPTERLHVNGNILATGTITPDYVFQKYFEGESSLKADYDMMSLEEVEAFAKINKHLPGVPSAQEVEEKGGIVLNRQSEILLEKVEELFLHTIEQQKQIEALKAQVKQLEADKN